MNTTKIFAAASLSFLGIVSPASADMVTLTCTGTVEGGFDQLGAFGTRNTSLTELSGVGGVG